MRFTDDILIFLLWGLLGVGLGHGAIYLNAGGQRIGEWLRAAWSRLRTLWRHQSGR